MKLKHVLLLAFLTLTLLPIAIVSFLLYKSGFELSKQSYTRNLVESLLVQEDDIGQTLENNMIYDHRFTNKIKKMLQADDDSTDQRTRELLPAVQSYLEFSEDKITLCLLLNSTNDALYTIGEKSAVDGVLEQLPDLSAMTGQTIMEFRLGQGTPSIGVVTPIRDSQGVYLGGLVSVYNRHYIFKTISNYYKIASSSIYLCRKNGEIIDFRAPANAERTAAVKTVLESLPASAEGLLDTRVGAVSLLGYYKSIRNTPWMLVGFVDEALIHEFTNQFVWVYLWIITGVVLADLALALYVSQKVVGPINALIKVMDSYKDQLSKRVPAWEGKTSYFEIRYLWTTFADLMKTILRVRHNFEGVYQLYQSSDMGDINIDIDTINQTAISNKDVFQKLMDQLDVPEGSCVLERFVRCFSEKDRLMLTSMFEQMRDEHLSIAREAEVSTPFLNQKWFHILVVPMYEDDRLSRLFIQLRDISGFKKQEIVSMEQAQKDALTGLYNRSGFMRHAREQLSTEHGAAQHLLLFIDMNFFKLVNDTFGHRTGDDLLCSVASILRETVAPDGLPARFGGDEFVVLLPDPDGERLQGIKATLAKRLVFPFDTGNVAFTVSASVGVAVWKRAQPCTMEELLQQADMDMYEVKRAFKENTR